MIDGKGEFIGGKGVSASQKRSEEFRYNGCVTYYVTYFMYIDHVDMYFYITFYEQFFIFFYSTFFLSFLFRCYIY